MKPIFKNDNVTYFEVLTSIAGEQFALELGEVLEVTGSIPAVLAAYERQGIVRRLPDPGDLLPWLRLATTIRPVSDATFVARPEPPEPEQVEQADLLRRMRWSPEQLQTARDRLAFPAPIRRRSRFDNRTGETTVIATYWNADAIAQWQREVPKDLFVGARH